MFKSSLFLTIRRGLIPFRGKVRGGSRLIHALLYSACLAALVFFLKWIQWKFLIIDNSLEIYVGLIAVFFTLLGVWVASHLTKTKVQTVVIEKEVKVLVSDMDINEEELSKLNLSAREYEVLTLINQGKSNGDIADTLFLSLSTVKTHVSNIFIKMDVKSRTQAIEKSRRLKITA